MRNDNPGRSFWRGAVGLSALILVIGSGAWVMTARQRTSPTPPWRIESALPDRCLLHVSVDGAALQDEGGRLALADLMREPQMKEFLTPIIDTVEAEVSGMVREGAKELGFEVDDIGAFLRGGFTLTLVDLAFQEGSDQPDVDAVLTFQLSKHEELLGKLSSLVRDAMEKQLGVQPEVTEVAGHPAVTVDLDGVRVTWCVAGDHLLAGTKAATLAAVVDRVKAQSATAGLLGNPDVARALSRTVASRRPIAFVHADLERAMQVADQTPVGDEIRPMLEFAGLNQWKSFSYGLSVEGRAMVDRFFIHMPAGRRGLYAGTNHRTKPLRTLAMAPRDALFYEGVNYDLNAVATDLMARLPAFDEYLHDEIQEGLQSFQEEFGFSVTKDLLPSLGKELAIWAGPAPYGGMIPELVLAIELSDVAKFQSCLDAMLQHMGQGGPMRMFRFMDRDFGYLDTGVMMGGSGNGPGFGLKPSWVIDGDFALIALAPQSLKNLVASRTAQRPGLASNSDLNDGLAALRGVNAEAGKDAVVYVDLAGVLTMLVDTAVPLLQSMSMPARIPLPNGEEVANPVDFVKFPTTDVFRRHLFGLSASSTYTEDGMMSEIHSPTGYLSSFFGMGAVLGVVGVASARSVESFDDLPPLEPTEPTEPK